MTPLTTLPENWYPTTERALQLHTEFGREIDLRLSLRKFRLFHSEGQTSRNWESKFERWVISDVERSRASREGGTDDLGFPLSRRSSTTAPLQPGDPGYLSIDDLADMAQGMTPRDHTTTQEVPCES